MKQYFSPEKLEGENKYECGKCQKYTNAVKSISLKDAPLNLIINLKKFDKFGAKIKSDLKYPVKFNLNDYIGKTTTRRSGSSDKWYELYAVINHEGRNSHWGHYNSYIKGFNGNWYLCDDSRVRKISSEKSFKLSEKAYILFYRLADSCRDSIPSPRKISTVSTQIMGMENNEEKRSNKKPKSKTKSRFSRKRRRIIDEDDSSEEPKPRNEETKEDQLEIVCCAMSEVSDMTSTSSKRIKTRESDSFDLSLEIQIDL